MWRWEKSNRSASSRTQEISGWTQIPRQLIYLHTFSIKATLASKIFTQQFLNRLTQLYPCLAFSTNLQKRRILQHSRKLHERVLLRYPCRKFLSLALWFFVGIRLLCLYTVLLINCRSVAASSCSRTDRQLGRKKSLPKHLPIKRLLREHQILVDLFLQIISKLINMSQNRQPGQMLNGPMLGRILCTDQLLQIAWLFELQPTQILYRFQTLVSGFAFESWHARQGPTLDLIYCDDTGW